MADSLADHPVPDNVLVDMYSGYSVNVPAEWQDPNTGWWRDPVASQRIMNMRAAAGVQLHDALWAHTNGQPEPAPEADVYALDSQTGTYTRTDVRV